MTFWSTLRRHAWNSLLIILLALPSFVGAAHPLLTLAQKSLPESFVGMVAIDLEKGTVVEEINPHKLFMMASTTKLFTAWAALQSFGETHRFQTKLYQKGNDYYLVFDHDPTLSYQALQELFLILKGSSIKGHIYVVPSVSESLSPLGDKAMLEDETYCYGAPMDGMIVDENTVTYTFAPGTKEGAPLHVKPVKNNVGFELKNDAVTYPSLDKRDLDQSPLTHGVRLYGGYPLDQSEKKICFPVKNRFLKINHTITSILRSQEIRLDGSIKQARSLPKDAILLQTIASEPLQSTLKTMLQQSDNLIARTLFVATLMKQNPNFYKWEEAPHLFKNIWNTFFSGDLALDAPLIQDGDGIAYTNMTHPLHMGNFLKSLRQNPSLMSVFLTLLPTGDAGTLKGRLIELKGRLFAKTGSNSQVRSLAGFLVTQKGTPLAFCIFINHIAPQHGKEATALVDAITRQIDVTY